MLRSVSGLRRLVKSRQLVHVLWLAFTAALVFFLIALVLARAAAAGPAAYRGGSLQASSAPVTQPAWGRLAGLPDGAIREAWLTLQPRGV